MDPSLNHGELAENLGFLARPELWDRNGVDAAFSDKRLARLQFAAALGAAENAGLILDRDSLVRAGDLLVSDQASNGCWPIDEAAAIGSPTTYGSPLATALAVDALRRAGAPRFRDSIARAEAWFRSRPIQNVHDASSVLLAALGDALADRAKSDEAIAFLVSAQQEDGGWGPFLRSSSEPFDSALALLALSRVPDRRTVRESVGRGRRYLMAYQNADGSWPETTRPPGGESYAQRISTTAWAAMALRASAREEFKGVRATKS